MRYFLAILLPPQAVLFCGKPFPFLLNIFLTLPGRIPGVVHAIPVVYEHLSDKRIEKLLKGIK